MMNVIFSIVINGVVLVPFDYNSTIY